jgi:hypothetical protein
MDLTAQLEEQRAGAEVHSEAEATHDPAELPPPPPPPEPPTLNRAWLRLAYALEFWIALIAIFVVWSQVGGQPHLDIMAWYIKLTCAVAMAVCAVKMTSAMVERPRAWNTASITWFVAILIVATLMFCITYWYHLHEQDDQQNDENSATTVSNRTIEHRFPQSVTSRGRDNC